MYSINHKVSSLVYLDSTRISAQAQRYSNHIDQRGSAYDNIIGFIDGTRIRICRPTSGQESAYSGYKRAHCLLFQAVMFPDGIIGHVYGPTTGRHHDQFLLTKSGLQQALTEAVPGYKIYGDSGYRTFGGVISAKRITLTQLERQRNRDMSTIRISVEWGFAALHRLFNRFRKPSSLQIYRSSVGQEFKVALFLLNVRTCLDGRNQICDYFKLAPPSLEEYLACLS